MAVMDRASTSRTIAQQIQSAAHHSVNHRHLRHQWWDEQWEWTTEWNGIVFTDESRFYLQHHDGRIEFGRTVVTGC
ncbi:hypothetical protein TNCV_4238821 [Trichonephila clavipes]|nr:hypothetical protein TNCV_4238821 [Trichonephila clavipes]